MFFPVKKYLLSEILFSLENEENFENQTDLPNTNVPNRNFPNIHDKNSEQPIESVELDQTNKTTVNNRYDGSAGAYTDKYFNQAGNNEDNSDAQYYSLSGNMVSREYFRHDNMTPYFGSNVTTANPNTSYNEGILDKEFNKKIFEKNTYS